MVLPSGMTGEQDFKISLEHDTCVYELPRHA